MLELHRIICDMSPGTLANYEHLPQVSLGLSMTLESVFVTTLLLADLAIPSKSLQALGLHLVRQVLGCANCVYE